MTDDYKNTYDLSTMQDRMNAMALLVGGIGEFRKTATEIGVMTIDDENKPFLSKKHDNVLGL